MGFLVNWIHGPYTFLLLRLIQRPNARHAKGSHMPMILHCSTVVGGKRSGMLSDSQHMCHKTASHDEVRAESCVVETGKLNRWHNALRCSKQV